MTWYTLLEAPLTSETKHFKGSQLHSGCLSSLKQESGIAYKKWAYFPAMYRMVEMAELLKRSNFPLTFGDDALRLVPKSETDQSIAGLAINIGDVPYRYSMFMKQICCVTSYAESCRTLRTEQLLAFTLLGCCSCRYPSRLVIVPESLSAAAYSDSVPHFPSHWVFQFLRAMVKGNKKLDTQFAGGHAETIASMAARDYYWKSSVQRLSMAFDGYENVYRNAGTNRPTGTTVRVPAAKFQEIMDWLFEKLDSRVSLAKVSDEFWNKVMAARMF